MFISCGVYRLIIYKLLCANVCIELDSAMQSSGDDVFVPLQFEWSVKSNEVWSVCSDSVHLFIISSTAMDGYKNRFSVKFNSSFVVDRKIKEQKCFYKIKKL